MGKLNDKYYEGIVATDEVDPNHAGAVRVKISGVTDGLKMNELPWAIPSVVNLSAVPTKGTLLEISFDEGDINKPKYFNTSADKTYLPAEYVNEYPHVAVANLGGDLFTMIHDRKKRETTITHPSDSIVFWNDFGAIFHDSDKAYDNAGLGAKDNEGARVLPVLTEGTIDIFCCTPVGAGDAFQGSEYLQTAHISKATVDAINGETNEDLLTEAEKEKFGELGTESIVTKALVDSSGVTVEEVEFMLSPSFIEPVLGRTPTHVLIGVTNNNDFFGTAQKILDVNNELSAHYLVGQHVFVAPDSTEGTSGLQNVDRSGGFAQFVESTRDSSFGSTAFKSLRTNPALKVNKSAITILLVAESAGGEITNYQLEKIERILTHVKYTYENDGIELLLLRQGDIIETVNNINEIEASSFL